MQKITPFLWYDNRAEEAAKFYTSVFKNSKIGSVTRYGKDQMGPEGQVMTVQFWLDGEEFTAINGGPHFTFTPAVSFVVSCKDQQEIDYYWDKLSEGGTPERCGWLKDKFGLSWQVIPDSLEKMLTDKNPEKSKRVMDEVLKMDKLILKTMEDAWRNG
jgi:predicted 3-demethylubiquinone-9 3-methyltransferase (glyoxalase superfamily)